MGSVFDDCKFKIGDKVYHATNKFVGPFLVIAQMLIRDHVGLNVAYGVERATSEGMHRLNVPEVALVAAVTVEGE